MPPNVRPPPVKETNPISAPPPSVADVQTIAQAAVSGVILFVSVLPTADIAHRGDIAVLEGAAGVADTIYVCAKKSDNTYTWVKIIDADSNLLVKSVVGI